MDCTDAYKEHIEYTFNAFCKVVIRYAAINAWRDRDKRRQREISFEYLAEERFYPFWYYVKKKYKLKVNFSYNLPFFIQPIFPSYSISVHTHSRIHLVIDIHNDCGFLPYYKMSLCIQIPIYRHVHNFLF